MTYFKVKAEWWDKQWETPSGFLKWLDSIAEQWQRILKPNGSLYCFASPKMSARVEVMLAERFNVLNHIVWAKSLADYPPGDTRLAALKISSKEQARIFSPWSERIIFAEHYGADNIAKGEAGYQAKCDELRGFVFEPLRAYLDGERERAGLTVRQVAEAFQQKTGSRTVTGMAGHWFKFSQWNLPTEENYRWLQALLNKQGRRSALPYEDFHQALRSRFERALRADYEYLRADYEDLRADYEDLRRPFSVTADVPYTDVWTFPTVQAYPGKHSCEKPAAMLEHIITASSRPGAVVLDCFAGSGSTLVAAKKLDRQFIGIEIDPHWVATINQRLGNFEHRAPSHEERLQWLETQVQAQSRKIARLEKRHQQLSLFA